MIKSITFHNSIPGTIYVASSSATQSATRNITSSSLKATNTRGTLNLIHFLAYFVYKIFS